MIKRVWVLIYIESGLKTTQESYLGRSILTQSEISLICLWILLKNEIGIFMISETKIDNSFPISQFTMTGYSILSGLIRQVMGVEYFCLLEKIFLAK